MRLIEKKIFLCGIFCFFFPATCSAYIDPGTGSFIIQLLIAGFLGALYALKVFWRQVLGFIVKVWQGLKGFF